MSSTVTSYLHSKNPTPTSFSVHSRALIPKPTSCLFFVLQQLTTREGVLNTHISELDTYPYPSVIKWSLIYIQVANLPGYYETRTNTTIHITNSHNFSNVLSTMRVFLVCLV